MSNKSESSLTTIKDWRDWAAQQLRDSSIDSPILDSDLLLCYILKCERISLFSRGEEQLNQNSQQWFRQLIQRRVEHEPVAYIIGEREFFGRPFKVTPAVLIPRPETELLVERALEIVKSFPRRRTLVVDVGTGSGAIASSFLAEVKERQLFPMELLEVLASDISSSALQIADENATLLGVRSDLSFIQGDLLQWLTVCSYEQILVLANLPYIPIAAELPFTVSGYEPPSALWAADEGMSEIWRLILWANKELRKSASRLLFEIGAGQAPLLLSRVNEIRRVNEMRCVNDVARVKEMGELAVLFRQDLQGIERIAEVFFASESFA